MRSKQAKPHHIKRNYRQYCADALTAAYIQCKEKKMPATRAAKIYQVPRTTLRDRLNGRVDPETVTSGKAPLFSMIEEAKLCEHFKTMASYGYGYTRRESVDLASDFAVQLGKRTKGNPLTLKWIRGFLKRWPELKVLKPRGLEYARARMASESIVSEYFRNLKNTIELHGLSDKPHLIFNLDEKGITTDHKPPCVVGSAAYCPQSVTSGRGNTVTILGCASASGVALPPFFVFPGKRMNADLLAGKSPGANAVMSESGWSNQAVFREYLEHHFLKFIPGRDGEEVLLILDGHKSHISVGISEWAREKGIILFILPPHTSHILQPMDVSCYGPFEKIYNYECHKLIRNTQAKITRYNICELACRVYSRALSTENVLSAFRQTGIYPHNPEVIPREYLKPAEVYEVDSNDVHMSMSQESQSTVEGGIDIRLSLEGEAFDMLELKEKQLKHVKSEPSKSRNTTSKIVAGKEIDHDIIKQLKNHESSSKQPKSSVKKAIKPRKSVKKDLPSKNVARASPVAGPSHINLLGSSPMTSDDDDDDDLCFACGLFQPKELQNCMSVVFTKWAQCDFEACKHWTHLEYCCSKNVIRLGDHFVCPCHEKDSHTEE